MGMIPVQRLTGIAGEDLTSYRWHAVKIATDGTVVHAGAGENAIGILEDGLAAGLAVSVMVLGECLAMYGASVTAGDNLASDSAGRLITAAGNADVIAVARDSGAVGEIHSVVLITRTSTGTINAKSILSIPVEFSQITAAMDAVTAFTPGFAGTIIKMDLLTTVPVTTAAKAATLTPYIGAVAVTGGVVGLTSVNATPLGKVVAGSAVSAANAFGATDTISIKATNVTAFTEGKGVLLITLG